MTSNSTKARCWAAGDSDRYVTYLRISDEAVGSANGPIIGTGHGKPERGNPGFAGTIADVEVDTETGLVTILNLVGVQDAGFAINPLSVKGQIQGGTIQGVGYALLEEIVYDEDGRVRNPRSPRLSAPHRGGRARRGRRHRGETQSIRLEGNAHRWRAQHRPAGRCHHKRNQRCSWHSAAQYAADAGTHCDGVA